MLIIDLILGALIAWLVVWGFSRGITVSTLALAAFGAGAVLGAHFAPLVLPGGLHSDYASEVAIPAALLIGALAAAQVERVGLRGRRRLDRLGLASPLGGSLLGGALGLMVVWSLGTVAVQFGSLRADIRDSAILSGLDTVLPPPGLAPSSTAPSRDAFPRIDGPAPVVAAIDPRITRAPGVRAAGHSVVKILVSGCAEAGSGSGWIAADGVVVTNAHVIDQAQVIGVGFTEGGHFFTATPILFDPENDIGVLRVPGVSGASPLSLARDPQAETQAAVLGFPFGHWTVGPARLGPTSNMNTGHMSDPPSGVSSKLFGRLITSFAGEGQPGNSGGPLVDRRGRVLTTLFGGSSTGEYGWGVANTVVQTDLRRALRDRSGPQVGTGRCATGARH